MPIYVVAVAGKAVAAFHADDEPGADRRLRDRVLRDDLMSLVTDGLPLWNGVAGIGVRLALAAESARWHTSRTRAIRLGSIAHDDEAWIAFLVPLTDPSRRRRP